MLEQILTYTRDGLIPLIQTLSPFLAAGFVWKAAHLYTLRTKQRDAIEKICDEILKLDTLYPVLFFEKIHQIRTRHAHYEKVFFGLKTPICLTEDMLELNALVESVIKYWEDHGPGVPTKPLPQKEMLDRVQERARRLRSCSRIVLFTI